LSRRQKHVEQVQCWSISDLCTLWVIQGCCWQVSAM
jgi:hypothetical protein